MASESESDAWSVTATTGGEGASEKTTQERYKELLEEKRVDDNDTRLMMGMLTEKGRAQYFALSPEEKKKELALWRKR